MWWKRRNNQKAPGRTGADDNQLSLEGDEMKVYVTIVAYYKNGEYVEERAYTTNHEYFTFEDGRTIHRGSPCFIADEL